MLIHQQQLVTDLNCLRTNFFLFSHEINSLRTNFSQLSDEVKSLRADVSAAQTTRRDIATGIRIPALKAEHPQAQAEHPQAQAEHHQAQAEHPQAQAEHPQAQAEHPQAQAEHPQAQAEHTQAQAEHTQAVNVPVPVLSECSSRRCTSPQPSPVLAIVSSGDGERPCKRNRSLTVERE